MRSIRFFVSLVLLAALFALSGCGKNIISNPWGSSQPSGQSSSQGSQNSGQSGGTGKPYTIAGETYHPLISSEGFGEEGIASWYGKDFHGRKTANGEIYDMYGQTAAHKLLPFGTQVRVTNLDNGLSTVVRINDRGPFVANRIIDLSYTAASQINMVGPGTARVRIETIGEVVGLSSSGLSGDFYVQVGAFSNKSNAEALLARLRASGYSGRMLWVESRNLWRVQAGPWKSLSDAERMQNTLSNSYQGSLIVAD